MLLTWGRGKDGRLGHADGGVNHAAPQVVEALRTTPVEDVGLGNCHGAAIASTGELYVWGGGAFGELGLADVTEASAPTRLPILAHRIVSVSCGFYHSACVSDDGGTWTWGWGREGQLGHGEASSTPVRVSSLDAEPMSHVSCGHHSTCLLSRVGDALWLGELAELSLDTRVQPSSASATASFGRVHRAELPHAVAPAGLTAGGRHAAALLSDGSLWTWGSGVHGQLGLGDMTSRTHPSRVVGLRAVRMGCCGEDHTAAIASPVEGADLSQPPVLWVWGRSDYGSRFVAQGHSLPRPLTPKGLPPDAAGWIPVQLSCGYHHSACILSSGHLLVWTAHSVRGEPSVQLLAPAEGTTFRRIACGGFSTAIVAVSPYGQPAAMCIPAVSSAAAPGIDHPPVPRLASVVSATPHPAMNAPSVRHVTEAPDTFAHHSQRAAELGTPAMVEAPGALPTTAAIARAVVGRVGSGWVGAVDASGHGAPHLRARPKENDKDIELEPAVPFGELGLGLGPFRELGLTGPMASAGELIRARGDAGAVRHLTNQIDVLAALVQRETAARKDAEHGAAATARELEEAGRRLEAAEHGRIEAELGWQEAEQKRQTAELGRQEADRNLADAVEQLETQRAAREVMAQLLRTQGEGAAAGSDRFLQAPSAQGPYAPDDHARDYRFEDATPREAGSPSVSFRQPVAGSAPAPHAGDIRMHPVGGQTAVLDAHGSPGRSISSTIAHHPGERNTTSKEGASVQKQLLEAQAEVAGLRRALEHGAPSAELQGTQRQLHEARGIYLCFMYLHTSPHCNRVVGCLCALYFHKA